MGSGGLSIIQDENDSNQDSDFSCEEELFNQKKDDPSAKASNQRDKESVPGTSAAKVTEAVLGGAPIPGVDIASKVQLGFATQTSNVMSGDDPKPKK